MIKSKIFIINFVLLGNLYGFNYDAFIANGKSIIYNNERECLLSAKTKTKIRECKKETKKMLNKLYKDAFEKQKEEVIMKIDKRIKKIEKEYENIINKLRDRQACISIANNWKEIKKCYKKTKIKK